MGVVPFIFKIVIIRDAVNVSPFVLHKHPNEYPNWNEKICALYASYKSQQNVKCNNTSGLTLNLKKTPNEDWLRMFTILFMFLNNFFRFSCLLCNLKARKIVCQWQKRWKLCSSQKLNQELLLVQSTSRSDEWLDVNCDNFDNLWWKFQKCEFSLNSRKI